MLPVATVGNGFIGFCKAHKTTVSGFLQSNQSFVRINGLPITTVNSTGRGFCGHSTKIIQGSSFVRINGIPIARLTSAVGADTIVSGMVIQGQPFVRVMS